MPPKVSSPEVNGPPDGKQHVSFDVERVAPAVGGAQKFRFTIDVFRADNMFAHGGELKVQHTSGSKLQTVFAVKVPRQPHHASATVTTLQFVSEASVFGTIPVEPDPTQGFTLSFAAFNREQRIDVRKTLRYDKPIAA